MSRSRANRGRRASVQAVDAYLVAPTKPVYYLPVVVRGEVVGYLWASEDDSAVGFFCRKEVQRRDTVRAATVWSHRLRDAEAEGLKPSHVLHRWAGTREDSDAGDIPGEILQQHGDTADMLRNHGSYSPPRLAAARVDELGLIPPIQPESSGSSAVSQVATRSSGEC